MCLSASRQNLYQPSELDPKPAGERGEGCFSHIFLGINVPLYSCRRTYLIKHHPCIETEALVSQSDGQHQRTSQPELMHTMANCMRFHRISSPLLNRDSLSFIAALICLSISPFLSPPPLQRRIPSPPLLTLSVRRNGCQRCACVLLRVDGVPAGVAEGGDALEGGPTTGVPHQV